MNPMDSYWIIVQRSGDLPVRQRTGFVSCARSNWTPFYEVKPVPKQGPHGEVSSLDLRSQGNAGNL
jgi:hypothetical protein